MADQHFRGSRIVSDQVGEFELRVVWRAAGVNFTPGQLAVSKKQFLHEFQKTHLQPPIIHKGWFNIDDYGRKALSGVERALCRHLS